MKETKSEEEDKVKIEKEQGKDMKKTIQGKKRQLQEEGIKLQEEKPRRQILLGNQEDDRRTRRNR